MSDNNRQIIFEHENSLAVQENNFIFQTFCKGVVKKLSM